jgi:AcrR family transcriptional regulator
VSTVGGPSSSTRERLLATAERLFATRGVDAVSLREITRESGARNTVATQYYFSDRDGVLRAIFAKHEPSIDRARHDRLDRLLPSESDYPRQLASALVCPLAAKLGDPNGGPEFLRINGEVFYRSIGPPAGSPRPSSIARWRAAVEPQLQPDAARLHRRYIAALHSATELGRRAQTGPHVDDRLFVSHLIDVVLAILFGPISDETRQLADQRDRVVGQRPGVRG